MTVYIFEYIIRMVLNTLFASYNSNYYSFLHVTIEYSCRYLAAKSEADHYARELKREQEEIITVPDTGMLRYAFLFTFLLINQSY